MTRYLHLRIKEIVTYPLEIFPDTNLRLDLFSIHSGQFATVWVG